MFQTANAWLTNLLKWKGNQMATTFNDAPTKTVQVDGTDFAYRVIGDAGGPPIVLLHHFTGGAR